MINKITYQQEPSLYDGDGCFYSNIKNSAKQISLSSSVDQNYEALEKLFVKNNITYTIQRVSKINSYSVLRITSANSCEKFINFLNKSIYFGLERKNEKNSRYFTPLYKRWKF